ncbi:hypothetical protein EDB89DRAFT_1912546 [Lactarius sanguifluus]|nr:hypothetical protein EDB89DRAFT_1912546 [Lactarius sanguifluus]
MTEVATVSRYHHVLKSRWLDGKWNRRLDHLIFVLVKSADPYYRFWHDRQQADFLRIRFCKHIAAIYSHFPHLRPISDVPAASPAPSEPEPGSAPTPGTGTLTNAYHSLIQDVNVLSHKLVSEGTNQLAPSQAALEAVRSAKASLTVTIASANSSCPLPQEERIASNQHSWMETTESMGAKRVVKRRKVPEDPRPTEEAIGTAKGKRRRVYTDPYAGGERPGRLAKADAVSPAANQKACACTPPPASQPILAYAHLPTPVPSFPASQPIPGPAYSHAFLPTPTFALASSQPIPPPFSSFPLALGPATQVAHGYVFSPAPTSASPPTAALLQQPFFSTNPFSSPSPSTLPPLVPPHFRLSSLMDTTAPKSGMRNVVAATLSGDDSLAACSASRRAQDQKQVTTTTRHDRGNAHTLAACNDDDDAYIPPQCTDSLATCTESSGMKPTYGQLSFLDVGNLCHLDGKRSQLMEVACVHEWLATSKVLRAVLGWRVGGGGMLQAMSGWRVGAGTNGSGSCAQGDGNGLQC